MIAEQFPNPLVGNPDKGKYISVHKPDYDLEQKELQELRTWHQDNSFTIHVFVSMGSDRVHKYVYTSGVSTDNRIPSEVQMSLNILKEQLTELHRKSSEIQKRADELWDAERVVRESAQVPKWIRRFFVKG